MIPPAILMEELPVTEQASVTVTDTRVQIRDCIEGRDDRLVVVVGPCSIHDPVAALEYGGRLKEAAARHRDALVVVMRV